MGIRYRFIGKPQKERYCFLLFGGDFIRHAMQVQSSFAEAFAMVGNIYKTCFVICMRF